MVWGVANHLSTRSLFLTACVLAAGVPMRAMALGRCGPAPYVPECNKAICSSDTGGWDLLPLAYGTSCNGGAGICDGDGSCMIAYGKITGYIDGAPSRAGQPRIVGWACAKYVARSIDVHVYAGGPAGSGTFVTAATASVASEPAVAQACYVSGGAYRFDIPITPSMVSQFKSAPIYVHGISPVGTTNDLLSNSGAFKFPDGAVVGNIDGIFPTASDAQHIPGWACAHGVAGSINVHLYAGGPAGSGTFVTAATANLASEPDVASACKLDGATALRFDIPISAALNYQLRNKKIYVHGISPIGGSNDLIGNSGVFVFPCPTSPPKLNLSYVNPGIMFNTPGITYCPYKFDDAVTTALQNFSIPPTDDHFHYVYSNFPYYLGTAAGIVSGGGWTDEAGCVRDGLSCTVPQGTSLQPGSASNVCAYTRVAHDDWTPHHRDRDFNVHIIPLRPDGYIDGSLLGWANKMAPEDGSIPVLGIEVEWMYLYPRQGPATYWTSSLTGPIMLRTREPSDFFVVDRSTGEPKPLPPTVVNNDGWRADFPTRGDQAAVRGVPVFDCGHTAVAYGFDYGYRTELHPAVAMTWLHQQDVPKTSTVHIKAMSHAPYPFATHTAFDGLQATFKVPDYEPALPLCVGAVHPDYNLTRQDSANGWAGDSNFAAYIANQQPYGYFVGSADRDLPSDWTVSLSHAGGGTLSLSVRRNFADDSAIPGVAPDWPLLMGAHAAVCQPARNSSGAKINSCPDDCSACIPRTCAAVGAVCGSIDDGCGGYIWCGQCAVDGSTCNVSNRCDPPPPPPPPPPPKCADGLVDCCSDGLFCRTSCTNFQCP